MNFSLLMSVYCKDNPNYFDLALQSIATNKVLPTETVLVCDGMLTEDLEKVIAKYINRLSITCIRLKENIGSGLAIKEGLTHCKYEWIARFDADDICIPERFTKQLNFIIDNPKIDVCGGQILEFAKVPTDNKATLKVVPIEHTQISKFAKMRSPVNNVTAMFRKSAVLKAGSYQHAPLYEDYDLWVRMLMSGCQFANLPEILVYVRAGEAMYQRRGGWRYVTSEIEMQKKFYALGFLTKLEVSKNLFIRIPIRLMPNQLRGLIYKAVLRRSSKQ